MTSGVAEVGGVVLLHGIARTSRSMGPMARALGRAGYRTLNLGYASRRKPLDDLSDDIHDAVQGFAAGLDGPVHFVTHSMGGLLARVYLARRRPLRLGRVVMIAPPNRGSEVADLLQARAAYRAVFGPAGQQLTTAHGTALPSRLGPVDYEVGVIAGDRTVNPLLSLLVLRGANDGKITVRSTRLEGMADHVVVRASHPFVMRDGAAVALTIGFLRHGRFPTDQA